MPEDIENNSIVSIVIPCYNQGHYLATAIESVKNQTYKNYEIIIIDDGSNDNTREVAQAYGSEVKYIYQLNRGLSAARNKGIFSCSGEYVVFLDSDDWLYPNALEISINYMSNHPEIAFASGCYTDYFEKEEYYYDTIKEVNEKHYQNLLKGNYIGMIATVIFRLPILEKYKYDESLNSCEDYDLYLRIARIHPVGHHKNLIAVYRRHSKNMSRNYNRILSSALKVLKRQRKYMKGYEKAAYIEGLQKWKDYYCQELYTNLLNGKTKSSGKKLAMLLKYKPQYFLSYSIYSIQYRIGKLLKRNNN